LIVFIEVRFKDDITVVKPCQASSFKKVNNRQFSNQIGGAVMS